MNPADSPQLTGTPETKPVAAPRRAHVLRETRETRIDVELVLDGSGQAQLDTGIGFFDHMLTQLATHGRLDLTVRAAGDLEVDEHHTVEDVAIALGEALTIALGDRSGIERFGHAIVPMDESLATVAVDCSGRGHCTFAPTFTREKVGDLPTELVPHFFLSLALRAGLTLHVREEGGRNEHHRIEGVFKAFARALRAAVAQTAAGVPSSKGTLTD